LQNTLKFWSIHWQNFIFTLLGRPIPCWLCICASLGQSLIFSDLAAYIRDISVRKSDFRWVETPVLFFSVLG